MCTTEGFSAHSMSLSPINKNLNNQNSLRFGEKASNMWHGPFGHQQVLFLWMGWYWLTSLSAVKCKQLKWLFCTLLMSKFTFIQPKASNLIYRCLLKQKQLSNNCTTKYITSIRMSVWVTGDNISRRKLPISPLTTSKTMVALEVPSSLLIQVKVNAPAIRNVLQVGGNNKCQ